MPLRFGINFKYRSKRGNDRRESSSKVPYEAISSTQQSEDEVSLSSYLKRFSFNELKAATRNFQHDTLLGEGEFGCVYKGWIDERRLTGTKPGTGMVVAVKVLDQHNSLEGQRQWLAEITFLGMLQHPNIVKLIGYCLEDDHRLLVYEYMPRGSLENHLFRRAQLLPWTVRMKVALGAAKGLAFLHSDETNVIYRDFKASNILLDSDFNAKLSDFRLAKNGPTVDMSHVSTRVIGTYGYLAPEYIMRGQLSRKCDVYSFGVVLLEILSGRRAIDKSRPLKEQNLVEWARPYISKKKIVRVLDPRIEGQYSLSKALKVAHHAVRCLSSQPRSRPTMEEVVKTLEQLQSSNENEEPKESPRQNPEKVHGKSSIPSLVPESVPVSIPKTTELTDESEKTNFRLSAKSGVQGANINFTPHKDALMVPHMVTSFSENIDILLAGGTEIVVHETDGCSIAPEQRKIVKRSTACMVEKILRSIGDVNSKKIGIHGLGGIGKTSILKALEDDPKTKGMFDIIISVTLSKSWSMRQIQDQVARKLSLGEGIFDADSEIGFFKTLQTKKFLLILDDVVKKINLNDLVIDPSSLADGSRLVFATRSQEVCHAMAEIIIEVKGLSFGEGWELFCELVGPITEFPDIQPYARGIVEQCCGLPILLILTGKALTNENEIGAWESAFKEFLIPVKSGTSDTDFLNQKLQFIYKRLKAYGAKDHVMRSGCDLQGCFLYCALFPQDQVINIPKLLECWMQEGLITSNVIEPCKKGHEIIKVLLDAALLESVEQGHSIKMHKVVRDFALELVLPEVEARRFLVTVDFSFMQPPNLGRSPFSGSFDQYLLKAGGGITKAPLDEEWEQAKMMFLMDNELSSLPERPKCRNLSGLFLQRNHCLKAIPVSFFNYMPYLQVLNLSNSAITCLPKSISNLKRLKELMMRDCERLVKLPSQLGGLQRLEVLDLHGTEIDKLPRNIEQLAFLTCMRVHFYGSVDNMEYSKLSPELFSKKTMSGLLFLRILSIVVVPGDPRWIKVAEVVTRDICKLRSLIDLSFYFPQVELLHLFVESSLSWRGNDLKKFNFVAGHDVKRMVSRVPYDVDFEYNKRAQRLRFVNGEGVPDAVCEVLRRTTAFYLDHHLKVHSLSQFGVQKMTWLEVCVARECPELETIIDSEELTFPLLQLLSIHYLENLKSIWHGRLLPGSFASLKCLYVYTCRRLNFVLESSMTWYISNLEELVVVDCLAMTELIHEDMDNIVRPGDILLPRLKTLTLRHLPRLVCLWKGSWPSLEHISICYCPNLRSLNIELDTKLTSSIKEIKAEIDWWSKLEWKDTSLSQKLEACFVPLDDNEGLKI